MPSLVKADSKLERQKLRLKKFIESKFFFYNLNRNVIFKNYNMVARVVAGFHQLSYFQLHCGGASGGDGLHEHNLVV